MVYINLFTVMTSRDPQPVSTPGQAPNLAGDSFVAVFRDQRKQARQLLHDQRERIRSIEVKLIEQVQRAIDELEQDRTSNKESTTACQHLSAELEAKRNDLILRERQFETRQTAWEQRRAEMERTCDELFGQLNSQLQEIAIQRSALQAGEVQLREGQDQSALDTANRAAVDAIATRAVQDAKAIRNEAKRNRPAPPPLARVNDAGGPLNWETLKQQFLTQMESENDADSGLSDEERRTVAEIIECTNQIVADKDRQIHELETLLHEQSSNVGGVAIGAAAIAQIIDQDTLVIEERDTLRRLQGEWRDKMGKAELEISIERAKIARERVALEEKIRQLESEKASMQFSGGKEAGQKGTQKGNWMARLGLLDNNEK